MSVQKKRRSKFFNLLCVFAPLFLLSGPAAHWTLQPSWLLALTIVDKTVPERTFREYMALIWSLNHFKISHPQGRNWDFSTEHRYTKGKGTAVPFHYWFDLDLTQSGAALLSKERISQRFPAILLKEKPSLRLYLAGDASDSALALGSWSWSEHQTWFRYWPFVNPNAEQSDFFWRIYVPVLPNVMTDFSRNIPSDRSCKPWQSVIFPLWI